MRPGKHYRVVSERLVDYHQYTAAYEWVPAELLKW